ncbi:MAG TPA: glycosyltransferase [Candidatus Sulfotelmatobacter sp.]|jgi:cellulose synthase/poly-beta-1,6-N-acetylglucosamine synthase-like glycosyltransferase
MKIVFWIGAGWLLYVYAGYPIALWLLGCFRRVHPVAGDALPTVSVLISARNEEKDIEWKVRQTLAWDYPVEQLQVLVASDASEDRTDALLHSIRDPRFGFIRLPERVGKNSALNRLAAMANGDLLFFTDANSDIDAGCLRRMVRHFADPRVGCVTGVEDAVSGEPAAGLSTGGGAYLEYESAINRLESDLGSVLVCDGSIFCMRRTLYRDVRPELANDLELPLRVGRGGAWVLYEPSARSREYTTPSASEEFSRRKRICGQGILGLWTLREQLTGLRAWQFFSRKFLRWFSLAPMFTIFVASVALRLDRWYAALLGLQCVFFALAAMGWLMSRQGKRPGRIIALPFYFLLMNVAAVRGIAEALLGRRFAVWDIAQLSRGRQGAA